MSNTTVNEIEFTRINNDVNGNPRYVCHFYALITEQERSNAVKDQCEGKNSGFIDAMYDIAVKKARKIGGKRFHNKQYGGGIVFQSYSLPELEKLINEAKNS